MISKVKELIKSHIKKDEIEQALNLLYEYSLNAHKVDIVILISRWNGLKRSKIRGEISEEAFLVERNKIVSAAYELISFLPENWSNVQLEKRKIEDDIFQILLGNWGCKIEELICFDLSLKSDKSFLFINTIDREYLLNRLKKEDDMSDFSLFILKSYFNTLDRWGPNKFNGTWDVVDAESISLKISEVGIKDSFSWKEKIARKMYTYIFFKLDWDNDNENEDQERLILNLKWDNLKLFLESPFPKDFDDDESGEKLLFYKV